MMLLRHAATPLLLIDITPPLAHAAAVMLLLLRT